MNLLKFGTGEHIPWGDIDFLTKMEDLTLLPRAHVRKHLLARSEAASGQRLEMCQRLQESINRELKEIKRRKKETEKRLKEIASKEEKGAIYCVGSNHRGQLGLGDLEDRNNFTVIPMTRGLCFEKVFTRNDLVFAITDSHSVYSWGSNGMGPMAISCEQHELRSNFHTPQLVNSLEEENILGIAVGSLHVCAFNDISIYSWGYNPCGWQEEQQGDDECDRTMRVLPDLIPNSIKEKIIDVASGGMHFCLLTQNGNICTWGKSSNGNLGHQGLKSEFVPVPRHLYLPVPIRKISCGSEHTMASSEFKVYTWGSNDGARLGLGDFEDREVPYEIVALSGLEILDISCGTWHNACIARQRPSTAEQQEEADYDIRGGWLFTWGSGYYGQLAIQGTNIVETPTIVPYFVENEIPLTKIYCGTYHNAAISSINRNLFTWGSNKHNCLGRVIIDKHETINNNDDSDVSFTSTPGQCEVFGNVMVDGIGRGYPQSVAVGNHYTIVCSGPYKQT